LSGKQKKKVLKEPRVQKRNKKGSKSSFFTFSEIFLLLGISVIVALFFMVVIFFNERLGITPWLSVVFLDHFTEGENWILFMISIILSFFISILVIVTIFKSRVRLD